MRFYRLDEVPISRDDLVFKESPTINAVWAVFLWGLAIALAIFNSTWKAAQGLGHWIPYVIAAFFGLIALVPFFNFRASLKPSNWLVRCNLSGIIVKYRAYENWSLPADSVQAVGFDYGEIAWAKLVKEWRTTPSMDSQHSTQSESRTYIDLGLVNPNTSELEANLQAEQSIRPDGMIIICDYPVQVLPGGVVEVRWTGGIRPSAKQALERLSQRVKILEPERRRTDLSYHRGTDPEIEKAKILTLAKSGDEMGAVQLTQHVYGYSLTQAKNHVDSLLGKKDA